MAIDTSLTAALGLGFVLGLRHATDADHVAGVSALVSEHRSLARSALLGTFWGVGHTVALLVAAVAVIAFKLSISPAVERGLEMAVAFLLIILGANVLLRATDRVTLHRHVHSHGAHAHDHGHLHARDAGRVEGQHGSHRHFHPVRMWRRPFLVGLLHGLAGSAALMLLVLAAIPNALAGLLYVLVFGVGSTAGMLLLSGLIGLPFALTARRSAVLQRGLQVLAGLASLGLGLWLAWHLATG